MGPRLLYIINLQQITAGRGLATPGRKVARPSSGRLWPPISNGRRRASEVKSRRLNICLRAATGGTGASDGHAGRLLRPIARTNLGRETRPQATTGGSRQRIVETKKNQVHCQINSTC